MVYGLIPKEGTRTSVYTKFVREDCSFYLMVGIAALVHYTYFHPDSL